MLMPSVFGESLFDEFMRDFPFYYDDKDMKKVDRKLYGRHGDHIMKTDVKEVEGGYELEIDLPGFTKDEVKASLKDGYLTVSASKGLDEDEKDKKTGRYLRRERYAGSCQRSFYVGDGVDDSAVKASFQHGILTLYLPKKVSKPEVEEDKYISIEG